MRQQQQSAEQLRLRTQVVAALLTDGPPLRANTRSGAVGNGEPTNATWTLAGGTRRVGKVVFVGQGTVKGDRLPIWVDEAGYPAESPLTGAGVVIDATVSALGLWLGALALLASAYRLTMFTLDRFRLAQWPQEWFQELDRKTHL